MDFRTALLTVVDRTLDDELASSLKGKRKNNPVWGILELYVRRLYFHKTGKRLSKTVDWSKLLDWLKENLPAIIQLIVSLLAVF